MELWSDGENECDGEGLFFWAVILNEVKDLVFH
jgi:hypothetical protein